MLLLGGVYLVGRRVISPRIPLSYLGTVALLTLLFPRGDGGALAWMTAQLCGGGLVLGAVFMPPTIPPHRSLRWDRPCSAWAAAC